MSQEIGLIPPCGEFRKLRSFQASQLVHDATVVFCDRFVDKRSQTHDHMVQAARSGVQSIAEGSLASATSKKIELRLTGVARTRLGELLVEYQDYLRQHGLKTWTKDSSESHDIRAKSRTLPELSEESDTSDTPDILATYSLGTASGEIAANTVICLINRASYLIWRRLQNLESEFMEAGSFAERLNSQRRQRQSRE